MNSHSIYIHRCLQLARLAGGNTAPNPLVGAVLVCDDKIIGEGFHRVFGQAHAEVNALADARARGNKALIPKATLYVNLGPCSHHGKTPPCADRIISEGIRKVVIANRDPFPEVSGTGIKKLREAGIEVIDDVCREEGRSLNRRFFTFHEKKRPYIILKFAQSADGFLAPENITKENRKISGPITDRLVHKWRSEERSILVGARTAEIDDPELTVRLVTGKNPLRIVIDPQNRLPKELKLFNQQVETLIFTRTENKIDRKNEWISVGEKEMLPATFDTLYDRKIISILVEGGAYTLQHFFNAGLWDECRVITGKKNFGNGIQSPRLSIQPDETIHSGDDKIDIYYNQ